MLIHASYDYFFFGLYDVERRGDTRWRWTAVPQKRRFTVPLSSSFVISEIDWSTAAPSSKFADCHGDAFLVRTGGSTAEKTFPC